MVLRRGITLAVVAVVALTTTHHSSLADTVVKRNGQKLEGEILEQDSDKVIIKTKFGTLTVPRAEVAEVTEGKTGADQFKDRWSDVDQKDTLALWELYEWCKESRLTKEGKTVLDRILLLDPDHEQARRASGFVLVDGTWLTKSEVAAAERKRRDDEKKARAAAAKDKSKDKGKGKTAADPLADLGDLAQEIKPFLDVVPSNKAQDQELATGLENFFGQKFSVATSVRFSIRAQLPMEDVMTHLALAERICVKCNKLFGLEADQQFWKAPYQIFHVKQKNTFIDLVDWIDDTIVEMDAETKKFFKDGGGMIQSQIPLSAQYERQVPLERAMAHWIGQTWMVYYSGGALRSWLSEGFAMYTAISEFGSNDLYCTTNTKYANDVEIADKNSDAAYQLVCLDIIDGALESSYPYVELIQKNTNQLDFADLSKSWSIVDFLMREHREEFKKYIGLLRQVQDEEQAMKKALGWTGEEFDAAWKDYVGRTYDRSGAK